MPSSRKCRDDLVGFGERYPRSFSHGPARITTAAHLFAAHVRTLLAEALFHVGPADRHLPDREARTPVARTD